MNDHHDVAYLRSTVKAALDLRLKSRTVRYVRKNIWLYIFILPAFLTVFVFGYLPMWGIALAFQDFEPIKGIFHSAFVGLQNFKEIFATPDLLRILRNTLAISLLGFVFGFPLPIMLAIFVCEVRSLKLKKFFQTASYLPHFVSWVVVAGLAYEMLNANDGALNNLLAFLGFRRVEFLTTPGLFWFVSVAIAIWKELGWSAIIYIAIITNIDPEYYEAAIIDGAGRFKRIIYITIPFLLPTIALFLILNAGGLLSGAGISPGFDGVFNLANPVVSDYSDILDVWIYKEGIMRANFSFGATVGLGLAVINFILVFIANKAANKIGNAGIL